jgi:hypothetical protein
MILTFAPGAVLAQQDQRLPPSKAEQMLQQNAEQNCFTFVVFYRSNDATAQKLATAIQNSIAQKTEPATLAFARVTDPAEKPLVDRLGVGRAPMPLCVAFAPNGAVTGLFQKTPSAEEFAKAFVTPTMSRCMRAMQDGRIVLLGVQVSSETPVPTGVSNFQAAPEFKDRAAILTLDTSDPAEADFLKQLEIDPANSGNIATVMLAPPGVLVGKYTAEVSFEQMAADLHAAGKCCDNPNCKHRKPPAGKAGATTTKKPAATQRR